MSILQSGYPLGAILGGIVSVYLLQNFGWRSLFFFGGLASAVMIPIAFWKLPESIDFMLLGDKAQYKDKISKLAERMNLIKYEISSTSEKAARQTYRTLLEAKYRLNTLCIWVGYFCLMFSFYFVVSWTPKLLVDAGLTTVQGVSAGIYLQMGGIIGALTLGYLTSRFQVTRLTSLYLLLSVLSMVIYGLANLSLVQLMFCASLMGFFLIGAMIGLYTIAPAIYPANLRVTGIGMAIGLGRIGGILAPFLAGYILEFGLHQSQSFIVFAAPLLVASLAIWQIRLSRTLS